MKCCVEEVVLQHLYLHGRDEPIVCESMLRIVVLKCYCKGSCDVGFLRLKVHGANRHGSLCGVVAEEACDCSATSLVVPSTNKAAARQFLGHNTTIPESHLVHCPSLINKRPIHSSSYLAISSQKCFSTKIPQP
jgi:hypothetical protein